MNVENAIRHKIDEVSANKLSVWEFEQWIEPMSWSMHRDLSAAEVSLIGRIQSLFSRFDHEHASEWQLRHELLSQFSIEPPKLWMPVLTAAPVMVSMDFDPEPAPSDWVLSTAAPAYQRVEFLPALAQV